MQYGSHHFSLFYTCGQFSSCLFTFTVIHVGRPAAGSCLFFCFWFAHGGEELILIGFALLSFFFVFSEITDTKQR